MGLKRAAVIQFVVRLDGMLTSSGSATTEQISQKYEEVKKYAVNV
jgi:hypothetical protein